ncbi:MAG: tetratricopeptide repeat protein, partial [Gemmatimonadales bacterium]
ALIVAVRARRRAPMVTLGLAWIGGTLLIVSNVIVPTGTLLAERTLYLPSVGAVLVAGWLLAWAEASWRHVGIAATAVLCGLGLVRTVTRTQIWRDNSRFFPQLVRDAPSSYRAWWVAGSLAYDAGNRRRGEAMVRRAILIYPLHPAIWETLGYRLEEDQRWHEAAQHFKAAFTLDSMRLEAGLRAGIAYLRAGFPDSAELVARRMSAVAPRNGRTYSLRGELAATEGRWLEAMTWRRRVAWKHPDSWVHWAATAEAGIAAASCWEARRSLERVRDLRPGFPRLGSMEQRLEAAGCGR